MFQVSTHHFYKCLQKDVEQFYMFTTNPFWKVDMTNWTNWTWILDIPYKGGPP